MAKPARLFLDTARLGAMSPTAQLAARDFARLAGEGFSTLYCEQFLKRGWPAADHPRRRSLPGLASWQGLGALKHSIRRLVRARPEAPVVLAARATSFMHFAARWLSARCRNVLVTDTLWPPYRTILEEEHRRRGLRVTTFALRTSLAVCSCSPSQLVEQIAAACRRAGCDGLFLAAVSHDGVRLPAIELASRLRHSATLRLAVVDGAQELAHVPLDLSQGACDLYLAGCHKWLGAYQPLGIAVLPNPATAPDCLQRLHEGPLGDPLLPFLLELEGSPAERSFETVNLAPLFSAWGALVDFHARRLTQRARFQGRLENCERVTALARPLGWQAGRPAAGLRSGIVLLQSVDAAVCRLAADQLQRSIEAQGLAITAYHGGLIRLSLPDRPLQRAQCRQIEQALDFQRHREQELHHPCAV